jgi:hypothetical protein
MVLTGAFLSVPEISLAQQAFTNSRGWNCTENARGVRSTTVTAVCVTSGGDYYRCSYELSQSGERTNESCTDRPYQNVPPQPQTTPPSGQPVQVAPTPPAPQPITVDVGAAGRAAATEVQNSSAQAQFVPLTNLPGFQNVSATDSLPDFLNQFYRLCIGAAAVIAVLQIMRAGAMHMFNKGSLSQSQNVRKLIQDSLLGLLLVLSPAIVFGIINPDILDISLNFGALEPDPLEQVGTNPRSIENLQQTCGFVPTPKEKEDIGNAGSALGQEYTTCSRSGNAASCLETLRTRAAELTRTHFSSRTAQHACISQYLVTHAQTTQRQPATRLATVITPYAQQCGIQTVITDIAIESIKRQLITRNEESNRCIAANALNTSSCLSTLREQAVDIIQRGLVQTSSEQARCLLDKTQNGGLIIGQLIRF